MAADLRVESPNSEAAPPTPRTMISMLRELDSIFESISTQTQESFLMDKSKEAKAVLFDPRLEEDVLTGRDVTLGCGVEDEEKERTASTSAEGKAVGYPPNATKSPGLSNAFDEDTAPIFQLCNDEEINACAWEQQQQQQQRGEVVLPESNSFHMETQTDISSQVLEGLWSLSGFPTGQDNRPQQQQQQLLLTPSLPSTMTHIETQTLDSEPVGFCDHLFSHMETQTTEDLFPDLMDCLASVDAESMADVIQCHDLNAPHVLRIFCDDDDAYTASASIFPAASRDATTNASLPSSDAAASTAKNDRCVQTHREFSFVTSDYGMSSDGKATATTMMTPLTMPTTTIEKEAESTSDTEDELMAAVSSLMDSQTQTYFHQMDLA